MTRTGLELLAVYLPFHFYPDAHWGIRFFERPMYWFATRLQRLLASNGVPLSWGQVLKLATYAVARHEFVHYLVELEALDHELRQGRRLYRPYVNGVYKPTYPGPNCLEETVANVWCWDNEGIRTPVALRDTVRDVLRRTPAPAYSKGADLNRATVGSVEDVLAAQVYQCSPKPTSPPKVSGTLPRPYVQPWTRYENVPFTMNRSLGGRLGPLLNAGPLRTTIRVYHR